LLVSKIKVIELTVVVLSDNKNLLIHELKLTIQELFVVVKS